MILIPQWLSNIEHYWDHPAAAYFLRRIASFSRLIIFDKRGTGLSDPVPSTQPLEERMDDVLAVMDAVGSERAVLFGPSEGGPMAALFAATYPDRCISLCCTAPARGGSRRPTTRRAVRPNVVQTHGQRWIDGWGTGASLSVLAPSLAARRAVPPLVGAVRAPLGAAGDGGADLRGAERSGHPRRPPRDPGPDADPPPPRATG